jgi:DNA-binding CsgD family transcriptional regulator
VQAPAGLEAFTFELGADEYCLFELDFAEVATPAELTCAEREVTALVLEGRTNEQIAKARGTSPSTVANQLQAIFEKLGVSGRPELVTHCVERARKSHE